MFAASIAAAFAHLSVLYLPLAVHRDALRPLSPITLCLLSDPSCVSNQEEF